MPSSPFSAWRKKTFADNYFGVLQKHDCSMSFMYNVATEVSSLCKKQSLKKKKK
ncbi:hypothetical protein IscW_ISCW010280 [Ixodes scapularis]|uniref:Uncharacterized protein n=1 Tax=Ixodes scapularis TaxID=6945 RepID=B7Q197_IXOSC|nr:hypothetical protein IscW_ISCW010280 [Ixodes scapularis]|eukprot:XP_002409134.1 hypothetical protein IscW_ISCW010280 [Ixodes scapularis]